VTPRFCLRCGARLRTVRDEGRRRARCPHCGWTFYDNPVPATAALIVQRGRVLLGRRARPPYAGTWDLPGGFLESGETPERGLGVGVRRLRFVGFTTDPYGRGGFAVLVILFRVTPTSFRVRAHDDVSELRWFPVGRVPYRKIAFAGLRGLVRRALTGR
jgi:ADP-ribose pyrophosphatase YjhB (NUDIX family)